MGDDVVLSTPKGPLRIELLRREAPLASRRFVDQCQANVWSAAQFYKAEPLAVYCRATTHNLRRGDAIERNPRIRFNRRGMVAYDAGSGSELVFCRGAESGPAPVVGTIFGCLTSDSVYVLESIANGPKEGNLLKYPVGTNVASMIDLPNPERGGGAGEKTGPEAKPGPEAKRRRIKIQLRDESDEDELPRPVAKATKRAQKATESEETAGQAVGQPSCPQSQELRGVIDFEQRLRAYNESAQRV